MTNLPQQIVDNVKKLGVTLAYGEKVELEGATLIPVALVSYGFGVGEESEDESPDEGGESSLGAGGGGMSMPVGAYVSDEFGTRFQPNIVTLLAVATPLVCVTGKALARIIRALKK